MVQWVFLSQLSVVVFSYLCIDLKNFIYSFIYFLEKVNLYISCQTICHEKTASFFFPCPV